MSSGSVEALIWLKYTCNYDPSKGKPEHFILAKKLMQGVRILGGKKGKWNRRGFGLLYGRTLLIPVREQALSRQIPLE